MLANSGTPLMLMTGMQLLIGNALIGLFEGLLIAWAFKVPRRRTILLMILANYFSAWVGFFALHEYMPLAQSGVGAEWFFYHLPVVLPAIVVASYLLSIILEWPFCVLAVWRQPNWLGLGKSILATLLAQTASYLVLLPIAFQYSSVSLLTETKIDPTLVSAVPDIATIYFISPDGRQLDRIRLNGRGRQVVRALPDLADEWTELYLHKQGLDRWDLLQTKQKNKWLLLPGVACDGATAWRWSGSDGEPCPVYSSVNVVEGEEQDLRVTPFWWLGLQVDNDKTGYHLWMRMEIPGLRWDVGNCTLLPGDLVVFEFGKQILLLDLTTRRIGWITEGSQPVVVLDSSAGPAATGPISDSK